MGNRVFNSNVLDSWIEKANKGDKAFEQKYRDYVDNLGLTVEQYRFLDEQIHETMRKQNVGREIISVRTIGGGIGKQQFSYDVLSHMSAAQIADLFKADVDLPDLERTNVHLPILQKGYQVNPRNLMASRDSGMPMNTLAAESAAKVVKDLENLYIIQGYSPDNGTTWGIPGLYNSAGQTEATALDWGTKANIETSIVNTLALLNAQEFYGPFNLVLNSVQYNQARATFSSTGISYITWVKEQIGGDIFIDSDISTGKGMMLATAGTQTSKTNGGLGGAYAEYVMPVDYTHEEETLQISHDLFGRVYTVGRVIVYDVDGICKMTAI